MEFDSVTDQENSVEAYAWEVLLRDHHVALFSVCFGSLVLGLPLAWNVLWHLKESKLRLVDFAFIYQIDFEYIGGILYL